MIFSEEYIGFKLIETNRIYNKKLNIIEYKDKNNNTIFSSCEEEKSKLILQLGVPNAEIALKAGKLVYFEYNIYLIVKMMFVE